MDSIEADMLRGLAPDALDAMRRALSACALSLESTKTAPLTRATPGLR
jgi:hypothetical protein